MGGYSPCSGGDLKRLKGPEKTGLESKSGLVSLLVLEARYSCNLEDRFVYHGGFQSVIDAVRPFKYLSHHVKLLKIHQIERHHRVHRRKALCEYYLYASSEIPAPPAPQQSDRLLHIILRLVSTRSSTPHQQRALTLQLSSIMIVSPSSPTTTPPPPLISPPPPCLALNLAASCANIPLCKKKATSHQPPIQAIHSAKRILIIRIRGNRLTVIKASRIPPCRCTSFWLVIWYCW